MLDIRTICHQAAGTIKYAIHCRNSVICLANLINISPRHIIMIAVKGIYGFFLYFNPIFFLRNLIFTEIIPTCLNV